MICIGFLATRALSQTDSIIHSTKKKRQVILAGGSGALTLGSLVYLNQAWYASYNTGHFHFFNDNREWLQMDKAGHLWTNYQMARLMMDAFEWAGYTPKTRRLLGAMIGFSYMTAVEVMDGFSKGWGFSWGDELADAAGTALAVWQESVWREQKIQLKFSYTASGLARYNPNLLGKNPGTQILKDYNGQSYWLSINPCSFGTNNGKWPAWLNLALGYKGNGMLGANENKTVIYGEGGQRITFERLRNYYTSVDINLSKVKTKNKTLKALLSTFNILKIPAPALAFNKHGVKFHYLYF